MGEFAKRLLFGLLAAPAFLACAWLGGWYWAAVLAVVVLAMQRELIVLFEAAQAPVNPAWAYASGMVVLFHAWNPWIVSSLLALLLLLLAVEVVRSDAVRFPGIVFSLFVGGFIPFMMSPLLTIRSAGGDESGFSLLLLLFLMVWGNDSLAYFGGRWLGKHPLAPAISPKKTWEGFGFGFLGAALGFALAWWLSPVGSVGSMWPLVVLVSVFGPLGDLAESRLKRYVNVKDSGALLPGHGGFLDRFDAMLLCGPVFWIYLDLLRQFEIISL